MQRRLGAQRWLSRWPCPRRPRSPAWHTVGVQETLGQLTNERNAGLMLKTQDDFVDLTNLLSGERVEVHLSCKERTACVHV